MATKTISIDMEAYEKLRRARRHTKESFSQVIHRAEWKLDAPSAADLLRTIGEIEPLSEDEISRLETNQTLDQPPSDKWAD